MTAAQQPTAAQRLDGAAAAVIRTDARGGARIAASNECTWPDTLGIMGWDVDTEGFGVVSGLARGLDTVAHHTEVAARLTVPQRLSSEPNITRVVLHEQHAERTPVLEERGSAIAVDGREPRARARHLGGGVEKFSLHYEADLDRGGISVLDIRPLLWRDGWPVAGNNFVAGTYSIESARTGTVMRS